MPAPGRFAAHLEVMHMTRTSGDPHTTWPESAFVLAGPVLALLGTGASLAVRTGAKHLGL